MGDALECQMNLFTLTDAIFHLNVINTDAQSHKADTVVNTVTEKYVRDDMFGLKV